MPNKPRSDRPQSLDAYDRVVAEIRAGTLSPGDRLTETELASRLGLSRTPVREAIRRLETDGLVVHAPRVGASIRRLDHGEISELYDMRAVLEATAAGFAARAASTVELSELAAIHAEFAKAEGAEAMFTLNRQFHQGVLMAARNRFLVKAVEAVNTTLLILGPSTMQELARAQSVVGEHAAILKALEARDADRAEAEMRAHIHGSHRARLRQLRARAEAHHDG